MVKRMDKEVILEAIAREIQTGVAVVDRHGRVLYANPFFKKCFPSAQSVDGARIENIVADEGLLDAVRDFMRSRLHGARDIEIFEGGKFFKVHMMPVEENREENLLLFLRDITEEKRVEAIKRDFVANVSHEMRTPLASIKGYSETLLDGAMDDRNTLRDFLKIIDRHATRMSRLIDDLLILSRLESQQVPVNPCPMDLKGLVLSTTASFERQAADKGIRLSASLPEGLPPVLGDRDRLEQVMVNLLDNAIKYTPSGGSVEVAACESDGMVQVDVKDTGIGIPPEDIPRIFERFYRVDKARSRELGGTGLGLAIVKHIIQGHDGRVWVESEPGRGSTFSFTLRSSGGAS